MTSRWLALPIMATALWVVSNSAPPKAYAATSQDGYGQHDHDQGGWDQPPGEFHDVQRRGFHDGIEAARRDFEHHRRADADDHDEYRHPHVDRNARDEYREGFRRGYDVGMRHMMGDRDNH